MSTGGRRDSGRRRQLARYPYTPEVGEQIIQDVAKGYALTEASARAGIPYSTVMHWLHRGRQYGGPIEWRRFAVRLACVDAVRSREQYERLLAETMPEIQDPEFGSRDLRDG